MKETACFSLLFIFIGFYSGAMSIIAIAIFTVIGILLTYVAWLEDKKERIAKQKLVLLRKERLARRNII